MRARVLLSIISLACCSTSAAAGSPTTAPATQAALSEGDAKTALAGALAPLVTAAIEAAKAQGAGGVVLRVGPNGQAAAERYPLRQAIVAAALDHGTGVLTLDETV